VAFASIPMRVVSAIKAPSAANQAGFGIDILLECMFEGEYVRVRDDSAAHHAELLGQRFPVRIFNNTDPGREQIGRDLPIHDSGRRFIRVGFSSVALPPPLRCARPP
jgi:hypothetical protein